MSKLSNFAGVLDRLTGSASTKLAINSRIGEYGKMLELMIDNKTKKVTVSVLLKNEESPIKVTVDKYEFVKSDSRASVVIKEASSDKAWLDAVLKNFVVGRPFAIPSKTVD